MHNNKTFCLVILFVKKGIHNMPVSMESVNNGRNKAISSKFHGNLCFCDRIVNILLF